MGFISKLISFFTGTKSMQDEFNKHPATIVKYVLDNGYRTPEQQRDFCKRLEIDYNQLRREIEKVKSVNAWAKKLTTLWAGSDQRVTFDYTDSDGVSEQRTIEVEEVLMNSEHHFYIKGLCLSRKEQRHFNVERIKNFNINGINTNFFEWCKTSLDIDPLSILPPKTKSNVNQVIWQGECPPTTFTYRDGDRERVTVLPIRLERCGTYQNLIATTKNGIEKTYFVQNIETMLTTEGHKKKHFDDWVNDVLLTY
ncbi:WYL domain-containing protein [Vibrio cincinnatiensis]